MGASAVPDDLIAEMRAWAGKPGCLCYTIRGKDGPVAIFKDDVDNHETDEDLLAFIRARCRE